MNRYYKEYLNKKICGTKLLSIGRTPGGIAQYNCLCSCGANFTTTCTNILDKKVTNCGHTKIFSGSPVIYQKYKNTTVGNFYIYNIVQRSGVWNFLIKCFCEKFILKKISYIIDNKYTSCTCYKDRSDSKIVPIEERLEKHAYKKIKKSAKERLIEFSLTKDEYIQIVLSPCYFCGEKDSNKSYVYRGKTKYELSHNGIDRLDSSKGYTISNCVSACKFCNYAKNNRTELAFMNWVKKTHSFLTTKNWYNKLEVVI